MRRFTAFLFAFLVTSYASSQMTGHVNYEKYGIAFDIPEGWVGQEGDGVLLLGSNTIAGVVLITTHNYNLDQLTSEARKGIKDENGTNLLLDGELESLSSSVIGGLFQGTLEWQQVKAYTIGMENRSGLGLTIMATTTSDQFSDTHINVAKSIYRSVKFTKVDRSGELEEWKTWLSNVKLTYMDSYYSSSYTSGGVSGGYSSETVIDLCARGYFNYGSSSNVSASGAGVSGYNTSQGAGNGTWDIRIDSNGEPALLLSFHNGEQYTYLLEYRDEKLFLNGYRYFRTTEGDYAPNCD